MITPYIIGQVLGILYLVVGLSILFNKRHTAKALEALVRNPGTFWLAGFIALLMGSIILALSNFSGFLPSFVTIIGIIAFFKGLIILWSPKKTLKLYTDIENSKKRIMIAGLASLVIAVLLLANSF